MKSSWLAGIVLLYVGLLFLSMVAENNSAIGASDINLFNGILNPQGTDFSNPLVATYSLMTDVWQYVKLFIQIVFLWFPDLWTGSWIWFYYFVAFPISAMMIFSFISLLRGSFTT